MGIMTGAAALWRRRAGSSDRTRDLTDAAVTAAVGLLFVVIDLVDIWVEDPAGTPVGRWEHLATLALGCTVMLGKRARPGAALAAGVALFTVDLWLGGSLGLVLVFFDLVYSAALLGRPRLVTGLRVGVPVSVTLAVVVGFALTRDVRTAAFLGVQVVAFVASPVWWGLSVRRQAELTRLAEARADDLRRLAELREQDVRTEERARMARDLHDVIAGDLSAIALHAEAALARPPGEDDAPARDRSALEAVRAASLRSLTEMRSMIMLLRAGADPVPAASRLRDVPALAASVRGHDVVVLPGDAAALPSLPSAVDQAGYRIVQESVTNAVKHAPGGRSRIDLVVRDHVVEVDVATWPAHGGAPATGPVTGGLGLLTMRERAESLGGSLDAGWTDDGSWVVHAELPVAAS